MRIEINLSTGRENRDFDAAFFDILKEARTQIKN
jgi:hypothetical protein